MPDDTTDSASRQRLVDALIEIGFRIPTEALAMPGYSGIIVALKAGGPWRGRRRTRPAAVIAEGFPPPPWGEQLPAGVR